MSKYHISRRLQFIIQYVNDRNYASKDQLVEFLNSKDFDISERTLERDMSKIRADFGIELGYSKQHNGYFIDKDRSVKVESFFKFLELVTLADVFSDGLKDNHKVLDYVIFDDSSKLKGIENLETILIAIKQDRVLEFTHYNYYKNTKTAYSITPLVLKEYLNRWYVIGLPDGKSEIRTFGIDRLLEMKLSELTKLNKLKYLKQIAKFDNIIGLNYSKNEPENIIIKVTNNHLKYLESLPLHASQKTIEMNKDFSYVSYDLIPNYEFIIEILKMSIEVEVIEPLWFREKIKQKVSAIYNKYNNA
ncbi:helix-turn-helix transcriptional regulator [Mariniflexile sp. HNIBRBA6329]|uniref:helix-turn-helix transcriptional regulator n=1 Tax=Mariniflexile sp. HNIBRBA6329 TaxID=3373088 RepID=UPI003746F073